MNVMLNVSEQWLKEEEIPRRLKSVVSRLEQQLQQSVVEWSPENYPHLHTPLSGSVVLQWAIRDGHQVNLPWALLVENDLILLKPGQAAPAKCRNILAPSFCLDAGQVFHVELDSGQEKKDEDIISPMPEFKPPTKPHLFRLEETPFLKVVCPVLDKEKSLKNKPSSLLSKYRQLFFSQLLVHMFMPAFFVLTVIWNGATQAQNLADRGVQLLLVNPTAVALPLLSLSFPLCWILANYGALTKVLSVYQSFRHVVTEDPFDDTLEPELVLPQQLATQPTAPTDLFSFFVSALLGKGEYLSRTENVVHALGSVTALCCTDKKGILSWPNTSPEKIFLLKKDTSGDMMNSNSERCKVKKSSITAEILTVTHDIRNPFKVEFDDPTWARYTGHLKPLGLSIMLNTCNVSTEEKYTSFFNHLVCESMRVAGAQREKGGKIGIRSGIDMLPIVTRGCLCELSKKIGFSHSVVESGYTLVNQVQTFRHVRSVMDNGEEEDKPTSTSSDPSGFNTKFIRNLHLARLKFPFPHMVSVLVRQRSSSSAGALHLFSQGTADIVLDSCIDAWSGQDLEPLSEDVRKKVLDFYQRASLSSYCTAYSYRPLTVPLPWSTVKEYLQLPTHSLPFYWHYTENPECADTDALHNMGHISLGTAANEEQQHVKNDEEEEDEYVKTRRDAMACLELECNQTFLGMVQLQYQALVDIVQLIDLLEKACIRFVHFSKENELRSRVFSEKMGLESGWNCHISLRSSKCDECDEVKVSSSVRKSNLVYKVVKKKAALGGGLGRTHIRSSLPDSLDSRPAWYLDFPKWQETRRYFNGDNRRESKASHQMYHQQHQQQQQQFQEEAISRQASVTSDSDPFDYDMSNRAQLPKGIENIRPHLEAMDNVPLLVSLFTDCTPDTSKEMITIMQDYGEVVCVMGSAANYQNLAIFLQADASLAIEPLYPQVCQNVPVFTAPRSGITASPTQLSQALISVASSLTFKVEDEVSIFHLILESRHLNLCLLNLMQFWTCCLVFLTLAQVTSQIFGTELLLTVGQVLWMGSLVVPLLSLSLMGPQQPDRDVMNVSTGKNQVVVDKSAVQHATWCYGLRYLPALIFVSVGHGLNSSPTVYNSLVVLLYLIGISVSFLFRSRHVWQRHPGHNKLWMATVFTLIMLQTIYTVADNLANVDDVAVPPASAWATWACGLPLVVILNEAVKRYEIKGEVRYQKRQRLEFGTKLGINSPF